MLAERINHTLLTCKIQQSLIKVNLLLHLLRENAFFHMVLLPGLFSQYFNQ